MIQIRKMAPRDKSLVLLWRNSPEVRRWMFSTHLISQDEHNMWFQRVVVDPSSYYWIIEHLKTPVGLVSFVQANQSPSQYSLGVYLGEESAKSIGAAAAGTFLAIDYVLSRSKQSLLVAEVKERNVKAIRLYERLGFSLGSMSDGAFGISQILRFELDQPKWIEVRSELAHRFEERGLIEL